jgi:hypothetical protein
LPTLFFLKKNVQITAGGLAEQSRIELNGQLSGDRRLMSDDESPVTTGPNGSLRGHWAAKNGDANYRSQNPAAAMAGSGWILSHGTVPDVVGW